MTMSNASRVARSDEPTESSPQLFRAYSVEQAHCFGVPASSFTDLVFTLSALTAQFFQQKKL